MAIHFYMFTYSVVVLHQVPQQRVALLANVVQVDVGHGVAARVRVFVRGRTWAATQKLSQLGKTLQQR